MSLIFSYCDSLGDCAALSLALQATLSLRREPLFFFFRPLPAAILDLSAASSIGSLVGSLSTAHCCSPPPTLVVGWLCGQMVDLLGSPWALLVFFSRRSIHIGGCMVERRWKTHPMWKGGNMKNLPFPE